MQPNEELRIQCIRGYEWPGDIKTLLPTEIEDLDFDEGALLRLASEKPNLDYFFLIFLSREYLELGLLWAKCAVQAGVDRFAIATVDDETLSVLSQAGIPHFKMCLPKELAHMEQYKNPAGFNGKGLAIIYSRLQLVKFLVKRQINVLACDVDALIMKNPRPFLKGDTDITFQRVVFFPKALARVWGFTACAGFVAFRGCNKVATFLDCVFANQREVSSDQIALNLALLEQGAKWSLVNNASQTDEHLLNTFSRHASQSIMGHIQNLDISLKALPATTFWRHSFINLDRNSNVVLHPNSPKCAQVKLDIFRSILGKPEMELLGA
jgi:hypothetical protein